MSGGRDPRPHRPLAALALCALVVSAVSAVSARAAEPTARAAFSRTRLLPTEQVRYTVTVSAERLGRNAAVPDPDFQDFDVIDGPAVSTSQNISMVNGEMSQSTARTYSWLLVPKKEGSLAVPPVTVDLGTGRTVQAGRVVIEVVSGQTAIAQPPGTPPRSAQPPDARPRARAEGNRPWEPQRRDPVLEIVADLDDDDVWLGQEVTLAHVLRYDVDVRQYQLRNAPDFPGFANTPQEIEHPQGRPVRDPRSGAVLHHEAVLTRWCLVPLSAGPHRLEGQGYILTLQDDPFRSVFPGFGGSPFEKQVTATTKPLQITVRALPDGAPASFDGAVGAFRLEGDLDVTAVKAGDGLTLTLTVDGAGSLRGVTPPRVSVPQGLKLFDPEVDEKAGLDAQARTQGRKTFKYPILVTEPGRHLIPAVEWSFFDPQTARYVTRSAGPFELDAAEAEAPAAAFAAGPVTQATASVEARGQDIRHVTATLQGWRPDLGQRPLPRWLWLALAVGPGLNVLLLGIGLARSLRTHDPATRRARGAARRARKHLQEARRAAAARRGSDAAHGVARAVAGLVGDRLQMGAELAPGEASSALVTAGAGALAAEVESLLRDCDLARFASGAGAEQAADLVSRGEALVGRLAGARLERAVAP